MPGPISAILSSFPPPRVSLTFPRVEPTRPHYYRVRRMRSNRHLRLFLALGAVLLALIIWISAAIELIAKGDRSQ